MNHHHLRSRLAQSTIELLFMGILVMTGIVVIGPYVLDAVKGHFKLWDSTSQEALNDRLVQARPDQIDLTAGACTCVRSPGSCHTQGCKATERATRKNCTPVGCETEYECNADDLCCIDPVRTQACYRSNYTPDPGKQWASYIPNELMAQGFHVNAAPNPPCDIGDRVYEFQCGAKSGQLLCKYDDQVSSVDGDRDCRPACTPPVLPGDPYTLCTDDDKDLAYDTNLKIVANGKCTAATKCEAQCAQGYIPTPDGMTCGQDTRCPPTAIAQYVGGRMGYTIYVSCTPGENIIRVSAIYSIAVNTANYNGSTTFQPGISSWYQFMTNSGNGCNGNECGSYAGLGFTYDGNKTITLIDACCRIGCSYAMCWHGGYRPLVNAVITWQ